MLSRICLRLPGTGMYWLRTFPDKSKCWSWLVWSWLDKSKLSAQVRNWCCRCPCLVTDSAEVFEISLSIQKIWWSLPMPSSQDFHTCGHLSCTSQNCLLYGSVPEEQPGIFWPTRYKRQVFIRAFSWALRWTELLQNGFEKNWMREQQDYVNEWAAFGTWKERKIKQPWRTMNEGPSGQTGQLKKFHTYIPKAQSLKWNVGLLDEAGKLKSRRVIWLSAKGPYSLHFREHSQDMFWFFFFILFILEGQKKYVK